MRDLFRVADFSLCLHMVERSWELCGIFFTRTLLLFMRASPLGPKHLSKSPPPDTITSGIKISTDEWGGGQGSFSVEDFKMIIKLNQIF